MNFYTRVSNDWQKIKKAWVYVDEWKPLKKAWVYDGNALQWRLFYNYQPINSSPTNTSAPVLSKVGSSLKIGRAHV